jgi:hypothetical protein
MRLDLLTSPLCPDCPTARRVVAEVAAAHPGTEVHEWDITRDPGPAVGRGLFITPAVIVDGGRVVIGVPTERDLIENRSASAAGEGMPEG